VEQHRHDESHPGSDVRLQPDFNPNPVLRIDVDGTVTYLNRAARESLRPVVSVGGSWLEAWPEVGRDSWHSLVTGGGPLQHEGAAGESVIAFSLVLDPEAAAVYGYGADVTELRRAQDSLAEQAAELREQALFPEMNPWPVFRLDLEGVVLRANKAAFTTFGDDVIGRSWFELAGAIDPGSWTAVVEAGERVSRETVVDERTLRFTVARGPGSAYVYVYGADVSALKEAEQTLQELALFPEMNPGPVLRVDVEGSIVLGNRAARTLFGSDEIVGRDWTDLCPGMTHGLLERVRTRAESVLHEADVGDQHLLFTHTPGMGGREVFVYGTDLTALKEAEQALRQSERMATLGTLAAGVAHELNNPAAAVQRAAQQLSQSLGELRQAEIAVDQLAPPAEVHAHLEHLERQVRTRAAEPPDFDPVTRSDIENDVELWLEDRDIDDPWDLAPALVASGMGPTELDDLADAVPADALNALVVWLARAFPVHAVLEEIRHGASRIAEIVRALKAYSYVDQAPVQSVDVNEGIRHTLIILQNKLKRGVTVDLRLAPDLERIQAFGGDLNQVWTNLIDNAVDAMDGSGRLTIRTANEDGWVRVEVEDDGPGIPSDVQGRVFDPFFTTKAPGEGTGLGLNTTFTIVSKKHGGRIELRSRPGRTTFVVRLPHVLGGGDDAVRAGGVS
jgi:signal transduction histidine kinase